jgi:hypothetical protein
MNSIVHQLDLPKGLLQEGEDEVVLFKIDSNG